MSPLTTVSSNDQIKTYSLFGYFPLPHPPAQLELGLYVKLLPKIKKKKKYSKYKINQPQKTRFPRQDAIKTS